MFGLSSIGLKAAILAVVAFAAFAGGVWIEHNLAAGRYAKLELSYAQAQEKAVAEARAEQTRLDGIATQAARREAAAQSKAADVARRRLKEVSRYVKDNRGCVTWGFVRVLDAAVHGLTPDALALGAGKSDDACSPFTATQLAQSVSDNYAAANANATQLDALSALLRQMKK